MNASCVCAFVGSVMPRSSSQVAMYLRSVASFMRTRKYCVSPCHALISPRNSSIGSGCSGCSGSCMVCLRNIHQGFGDHCNGLLFVTDDFRKRIKVYGHVLLLLRHEI